MNSVLPILYSYRRCPYAMRARMALKYADIQYEHREIELRNKPQSMLAISPKGTVPVLVADSLVLEQSMDIMHWALAQSDIDKWAAVDEQVAQVWIERNGSRCGTPLPRACSAIAKARPSVGH